MPPNFVVQGTRYILFSESGSTDKVPYWHKIAVREDKKSETSIWQIYSTQDVLEFRSASEQAAFLFSNF